MNARWLARALGLFSLALGLIQLVAPGRLSRLIGLRPRDDRETGMRAIGARELGAAAGLLTMPRPAPFMWARVAGDVMDLALLARAMRAPDARPDRTRAAMATIAGITALDLLGSVKLTREAANGRNGHQAGWGDGGAPTIGRADDPGHVRKSVSIARPRADVYAFWRDLSNLPRFMHHVESIETLDERRSRWTARSPIGSTVEWEAEIVEDVPDERIAWRSAEGSQIHNEGLVEFRDAPAGRGTIVTADFRYDPPGGALGVAFAKLTGEEPEQQTGDDLRRVKQLLETGEVVVSPASAGGRKLRQRPAQPTESTDGAGAAASATVDGGASR